MNKRYAYPWEGIRRNRREVHKRLCKEQKLFKQDKRKRLTSISNRKYKASLNKTAKEELGRTYKSARKAHMVEWFIVWRRKL